MSPAQPFTGYWGFSLQDCTGLFQHSGKDRKPWLQHICCKLISTDLLRHRFLEHVLQQTCSSRGLPSISERKPRSKGRKGLTPAARAPAFPLSRWVPARRKQFKSEAGCPRSGAVRCGSALPGRRRRAAGAGRGWQAAGNPPPAGAAGMAQASECRNSLLYYYSVKFALSTYATVFSVGARVCFAVLPGIGPTVPPPWVRFNFPVSKLPLSRHQTPVVKSGAMRVVKALVLWTSRV